MPIPASSDGTLVSPRAPVAPASPSVTASKNLGLPAPGDVVLAKLRIERVIGEGGMAVVYSARHELLDLPVALKVLVPDCLPEEALPRFFHEAKIAARIRNVHVCGVLDAGLLDDGSPYMLMELLEGRNLAELLAERGPLPVDFAVDLVLQALEGLAHAHAVGVIHRDLKPTNLFLAYSARRAPTLKVIDFGISKSHMLEGVTRAGAIVGSPTYMAPEQIDDPGMIDARSDLWAMGVVLYELLTGRMPFDADAIDVLVSRIRSDAPAPIRVHRPDLPSGLEMVISKCLSKAKDDRYADALALATVLAPFASTAPYERLARMRLLRNETGPISEPPRESGMRARNDAPPAPPFRPSPAPVLRETRRLTPRPVPPPPPSTSTPSTSTSSWLPLAAAACIVSAVSMAAGAGLWSLRHSKADVRPYTVQKTVDCAKPTPR
jgi:eukaryotic-like serine/threonine-protein kinase